MPTRYAIYFMPPAGSALWAFGSSIIGYDAATGDEPPPPAHLAIPLETLRAATLAPRRYGFHATLKAPFTLVHGATVEHLDTAARNFAAAREPREGPVLEVGEMDAFLALVPAVASPVLNDLAADCVRAFEPFRAPLSPDDRARRLEADLTPRERTHLDRWGYPYVFDDFKFHMSLTGALPDPLRADVRTALAALYAPLRRPLAIDAIAMFVQPDRTTRFRVLARYPFGA